MTRETVKNLSHIIRDKDLEIESLNLKNTTLLQVLQDSTGDNHVTQVSTVIQERDNLLKQIAIFQSDREKIISALNHKHQESLQFHAEIQRLNGVRHKEIESNDSLRHDYTLLSQQYEDKSQALLKSQHEMMNYKHKLLETENRLKQLKNQKQKREGKKEEVQNGEKIDDKPESEPNVRADELKERTRRVRQRMDSETLCELEIEVNQLRYDMHEKELECNKMNTLLTERTQQYGQQLQDTESKLKDALQQRDKIFNEKDKVVADLNSTIHKKDHQCREKETEITNVRKQFESLTFQFNGAQTELDDLTLNRDQTMCKLETAQSELGELRDAYNRVTIVVGDKDHELDTMKEKISALQRAMSEEGSGEVAEEVQRSMDEAESMHIKATQYRQERDQAYGTLQQQTNANEKLRQQVGTFFLFLNCTLSYLIGVVHNTKSI